jgi:hypothetical protein
MLHHVETLSPRVRLFNATYSFTTVLDQVQHLISIAFLHIDELTYFYPEHPGKLAALQLGAHLGTACAYSRLLYL